MPTNTEVGAAPTKNVVIENGYFTKVWQQHISEISDTLEGLWGPFGPKSLGLSIPVDDVRGEVRGNVMHLVITLTDFTSSQGDTITWQYPFTAADTVLDVYQEVSGAFVTSNGCYVSGKTITLPDLSASKVIIKGTILRK